MSHTVLSVFHGLSHLFFRQAYHLLTIATLFLREEIEAQRGFIFTEGLVTEILAAELMLYNHCTT